MTQHNPRTSYLRNKPKLPTVLSAELEVPGRLYPLTLASLLLVVGAVVEEVLQEQIRDNKARIELLA